MIDPRQLPGPAARPLRRALWLTRIGMFAERITRAFWPFAAVLMAVLAALMFGLQDVLPLEAAWALAVISVLGLLGALVWGLRRFHRPGWDEVAGRLDSTLPGRPISAITDRQTIGASDAASVAVWRVHVARMVEKVRSARAVRPDLRIAARDPFALRYVALVAFVMAVLFGSVWRLASVSELAPGGGGAGAAVPVAAWEGWVEPPAYTGKPSLYLADIPAGQLAVPQGSLITIRLYGEVGKLIVDETVSGRTGEPGSASAPSQSFEVVQDGNLAIRGPGGREWHISVVPDRPPTIAAAGPAERTVRGETKMDFVAEDDHGVVGAKARIELDLARVDRRYGLTIDPEPREPIEVDLPLSVTGDRHRIAETLREDFSQNPWATLPVTITLTAVDAADQTGESEPTQIVLPGRRFFDTMAMALIENRRDLMWNRENATRVTQVLRAVSWQPDGAFDQPGVYLKLRAVIRRMEAELEKGPLEPDFRDEVVQILWDLAIELEDGTLENALARMQEAQKRLQEAIRNGATPDEIQKLMDELRAATDQYIQMLAEQAPDGTDTPNEGQQGQMMSGNQLQEMMKQIQDLMEQGRMAEAQALLEQLQQMLENMQVTKAPGQGGPGDEAMQGLADTLRKQQELSDDTFGDLNGQQGADGRQPEGQQPGQQGQRGGRRGGQQPGQEGTDQGQGTDPGSLGDRQEALRKLLEDQQGRMPGAGTPEGDAARDALGRAGEAMDRAEEALRDGDLSGALDDQAQAMEALREGMRQLGDTMAKNQQPGQNQGDQQFGQANGPGGTRRDPLGRDPNGEGALRSDEALLQGQDVYRRARELLEELRRRAGEQNRPQDELDYLKRLLEQF